MSEDINNLDNQVEDIAPTAIDTADSQQEALQGVSEVEPAKSKQKKPKNLDTASDSIRAHQKATDEARFSNKLRGQRARSQAEKLLTRSLSGAIYAIVVIGCIFWGRIPTMVLVAAMAWLCCSEFYRIVRMGGRMPNEIIGLAAAILYPVAALYQPMASRGITLLLILTSGMWYVLTPRANISDAAITVFGPLYTGLMFASVVTLRASMPGLPGALLTFGVMGSVWVNDAFAYFVGSRIGKNKLAPRISPNKSWEGFFGGLVGSVLIWLILVLLQVPGITPLIAIIAGILCGITGVMGDLFESRLKRSVGVKDSGNIMPGHGGMLDRSDSMLFATMTALFVLQLGGVL